MEYREVYTRGGAPTGEIVEKHAPRRPGDYFRHVLLVMKTEDSPPPGQGEGQYIVQQRSLNARFYAGKWDVTGGGVQAGETPEDAVIREAEEELVLLITPDQLVFSRAFPVDWADGTGLLITMFACRARVPLGGFRFDPREVNDVGVFPFSVFRRQLMDHNDEAFCRLLDRIEETV